MHTVNTLTVGTRIYYTGDMANAEGEGTIDAVIPADKYRSKSYNITMDDGRVWLFVFAASFGNGPGVRFCTLESHNENRRKSMEAMQQRMRATTQKIGGA